MSYTIYKQDWPNYNQQVETKVLGEVRSTDVVRHFEMSRLGSMGI